MNFYNDYINIINDALKYDKRSRKLYGSNENILELSDRRDFLMKSIERTANVKSLDDLDSYFNLRPYQDEPLGAHPDFCHLKGTKETENGSIVSVFIDINGSTNLHRRYSEEIIKVITSTIQSAAIHTCYKFGGYIHRLQGDGIFVYFGGKKMNHKKAVQQALNAVTFVTAFVNYDLTRVFEIQDIEKIKVRTGIDLGYDEEVLWYDAGIGRCSEVTTVSLHTSLASKMQGYAKPNGVVIGQKIKDESCLNGDFFNLVLYSKGETEKRYIYEDRERHFYYTQYAFDWLRYLKQFEFIEVNEDGEVKIINTPTQLEELRKSAALIGVGNAYTDKLGNINPSGGVKNQPHRFHHGKE